MADVRRAIILTTGERYVALAGNFLSLAVVSRILAPGELGVAVVGAAIVGLAGTLREFAGSNLVIQRRSLSAEQVRAAFTLSLVITLTVSAGLMLAAPIAASAYGDVRLVPYLRVVAAALVLESFGQFVCVLLRRGMQFRKLAVINVAGTLTSTSAVIGLALLGFSYMSFAWAWLASAAVVSVLAQAMRRETWMYRPMFRGWRGLVVFGGYHGGTVLAYRLFESVPYLLLGRILTLDAAALYHRTVALCQLPDKVFLAGVSSVVLPAFAVEVRAGRELRRPYLRAIELVTAVQWPALLLLAVLAHPVVEIVLGPQWRAVAPLVQIVAVAWLFSFSFELNYPVLVALGAIRDVFLRAVIVFPVSAAIIAVAARYGLTAVAWSMLVAVPFHAFVGLTFVRRRLGLAWRDLAVSVRRSALVAAGTLVGPLGLALLAPPRFEGSLPLAALAVGLAAAGWLVALRLTRHPLLEEIVAALPHRLRAPLLRLGMALPAGE